MAIFLFLFVFLHFLHPNALRRRALAFFSIFPFWQRPCYFVHDLRCARIAIAIFVSPLYAYFDLPFYYFCVVCGFFLIYAGVSVCVYVFGRVCACVGYKPTGGCEGPTLALIPFSFLFCCSLFLRERFGLCWSRPLDRGATVKHVFSLSLSASFYQAHTHTHTTLFILFIFTWI